MAPLSYRVFGFRMTGSPATGITFTYTGLKRDTLAHVLNNEGLRTLGLWAAGEIGDGFFAFNYPRGVGLRIAGEESKGINEWTKKAEPAVSDNKPNAVIDGTSKMNS
jgi:hypothetical protein